MKSYEYTVFITAILLYITTLTAAIGSERIETRKSFQVRNPLTGRYIKQTNFDKRGKWHDFVNKQGGWLAYKEELRPINSDKLVQWEQEEENASTTIIETQQLRDEIAYSPDLNWNVLTPTIDASEIVNESEISLPCLDQLLFVHKPSDLLTLPGIGELKQTCLASTVNDWLNDQTSDGNILLKNAKTSAKKNPTSKKRKKIKKKKEYVPRPCHRLDLDTSGIVAIGLTPDALSLTSTLFEDKIIQKTYIALCAGHIEKDNGFIEYPIGKVASCNGDFNEFFCHVDNKSILKNGSPSIKKVVISDSSKFIEKSLRESKTEFRVSKRFTIETESGDVAKYTRVELIPYTGRGHQLRLHMASIGHPLLGDNLHAPISVAEASPRLCLHAERLELNCLVHKDGSFVKSKYKYYSNAIS
ncbi:hypothetical protein CTEN210_07812 [Chaetoceros tenuissimus]|uniref:Pseudouridine synthase RsuA/RluA-like domain-containing protein n=1 Tax=Chaetoceros tenuissimus TaxID=426638 RepID=A0AAD3CUE2_9STRA|nr:hypothetical protein CTEN210_07812 [Chaetoceros tenuissimus]